MHVSALSVFEHPPCALRWLSLSRPHTINMMINICSGVYHALYELLKRPELKHHAP